MLNAIHQYRTHMICLAVLCILGLSLRLIGIDNGLPFAQVTDETNEISRSMEIARLQVPRNTYHRVFFSILQIPVHAAHFAAYALTTPGFSLADLERIYFVDRASFILTTRIFTAILNVLTIIPCFLIARRITGRLAGGIVAGVLIALHPGLVYHAHFGLPDPVSVLWVAWLLFSVLWIMDGHSRGYVLAGIFSAALMLTRLQVIPILICIPLAHLVVWMSGERSLRRLFVPLIGYGVVVILANVILNPFIVLRPQMIVADLQFLLGTHWQGASSDATLLEKAMSNRTLPITAIGAGLSLVAMAGFVLAIIRRQSAVIVIALSGIIFTLFILPGGWVRVTYWLPSIVPAALLATYLLFSWWSAPQAAVRWIGAGAGLILVWMLAGQSVQVVMILSQPNTRELAAAWVEEHIDAHTAIVVGDEFVYSVPLFRDQDSIARLRDLQRSIPVYEYYAQYPNLLPANAYNLYGKEYTRLLVNDSAWRDLIANEQIDYVIEADYCEGTPDYGSQTEANFPVISATIRAELELVYVSSPFASDSCEQFIPNRTHLEMMRFDDWERVGPIIRIYRTSTQAE
jgi:hypothetical protein